MSARTPAGLGARGRRLWREITAEHDLSVAQREMLLDACRTADVLERLAAGIDGTEDLVTLDARGGARVAAAAVEYRQQSQSLKQLLVALRLPDEVTGKRPQLRSARGAQAPKGAGGATVSTLDRLRRPG